MDTMTKQDKAASAMAEATAWLDENGIGYRFIPQHQIKVGEINFWPGRGTITVDGEDQKRPVKGLDGFIMVLDSYGLIGGDSKHLLPPGDSLAFPDDGTEKINPFSQMKKTKFIPL